MKNCFGNAGAECSALKQKTCSHCKFYKHIDQAIEELKMSPLIHTNDELKKTLKEWEDRKKGQ